MRTQNPQMFEAAAASLASDNVQNPNIDAQPQQQQQPPPPPPPSS